VIFYLSKYIFLYLILYSIFLKNAPKIVQTSDPIKPGSTPVYTEKCEWRIGLIIPFDAFQILGISNLDFFRVRLVIWLLRYYEGVM